MNKFILIIFLIIGCQVLLAQEEPAESGQHRSESEQEEFKHHTIGVMIAHTHVPKGDPSVGSGSSLIIPSWGLGYFYFINPKWAIGLYVDIEIATYVIDTKDNPQLERERPVILAVEGLFKPGRHLVFLAGLGREFEANERFWVYRFGLEYEFEIGQHWSLAPKLVYDIKEDIFDSWTIGLAVAKGFGK